MFFTNPTRLWREIIETANPDARRKRLQEVGDVVDQQLVSLAERELAGNQPV